MCISFEKAQYSVMNINPGSKKIQWKYPYQRETPKNRPGLSKVIVLVGENRKSLMKTQLVPPVAPFRFGSFRKHGLCFAASVQFSTVFNLFR